MSQNSVGRVGASSSRRRFLQASGGVSVVALAGCIGGDLLGGGGETINILTWEEYAKKGLKGQIEEKLGVTLEITESTSSSDMFSAWNSGEFEQYDIAIPNNNYVPKMMAATKNGSPMIAPVDTDVVTNYDAIYDTFKGFADSQFTRDGNLYGVPIRFGWYGYSYDSRVIPEHEGSYEILFSESFEGTDLAGKLIMYDNHFKAMSATALYLGFRDAFEGKKVTLSQSQIKKVKQTMIEQKPLLQGYIAADPTFIKSFRQGNFVVGQSGRNEVVEMWTGGDEWPKVATPKEGALAWFESAVVSQASDNKKTAWKVVNEYIAAKNGAALAKAGVSPSVNPNTQKHLTDRQNELYGAIKPSRLSKMIPFKAVENETAWITAWEEIKSA